MNESLVFQTAQAQDDQLQEKRFIVIGSEQERQDFCHYCLAGKFQTACTQLALNSVYHPHDGQSGRVNHCLENYLRCAANATPTKWVLRFNRGLTLAIGSRQGV